MTAVGIDLVAVDAVAESVARHGARYLGRVFTEAELAAAGGRVGALAERVAVKEAAMKALRPGRDDALTWRDVELGADGRSVVLAGRAAQLARTRGISDLIVSVSRIAGYASAVVVSAAAQGEDQE